MITVTVKGLTPDGWFVRRAVSAPSIERAVEAAGGEAAGAEVVFPIDGEAFFGRGGADAPAIPSSRPALGPPRPRTRPRITPSGTASDAVAAP